MQAPFHYLLFMLSTLLGQDLTILGERCVVSINRQEARVTLEMKGLKVTDSDLEDVIKFLEETEDSISSSEQTSYRVDEIKFELDGEQTNAFIQLSYDDESAFFQDFNFFNTPNGDVLFHPLANEEVESTNGIKTLQDDLNVIKWSKTQEIKMSLVLSSSKEFRQLLRDYYGNLVPVEVK